MQPLPAFRARLRRGWNRFRPLPKPRYVSPAPHAASRFAPGVFQTPNVSTLANAALSCEARSHVTRALEELTPSEEIDGQVAFYRLCEAQFGGYWRFADLTTVLWAAATFVKPATYLEVGVRRGRSAAVVGSVAPDCEIYGLDVWTQDYAGGANPGPDFVRAELANAGHRGEVALLSGRSQETLPALLRERTDLYFDLITIDGDHSLMGAATDLANALPRLKVGGIVALDDIGRAPALRRAWRELVEEDSRFVAWQFTEAGFGVAAAIRVGDEPLLDTIRRAAVHTGRG